MPSRRVLETAKRFYSPCSTSLVSQLFDAVATRNQAGLTSRARGNCVILAEGNLQITHMPKPPMMSPPVAYPTEDGCANLEQFKDCVARLRTTQEARLPVDETNRAWCHFLALMYMNRSKQAIPKRPYLPDKTKLDVAAS